MRRLSARVAILAGALVLYAGTAFIVGHASTTTARFDQLAAAFLRGELYLPPDSDPYDLTPHAGRLHVPFPPLPALLLLPWVALRGVAAVNAVALSVLCGALSVAFVYLLLNGLRRRGWIETRATTPLWLTLLFAAGSVHWYIAVDGSVCFLGQTCTVLFLALAAWLAVRTPSPWPAGAALALALLGRPSVIGFWPLLAGLAGEHFRDEQRGALPPTNVRRRWRAWSLCSAVPLLLSLSAPGGVQLCAVRQSAGLRLCDAERQPGPAPRPADIRPVQPGFYPPQRLLAVAGATALAGRRISAPAQ